MTAQLKAAEQPYKDVIQGVNLQQSCIADRAVCCCSKPAVCDSVRAARTQRIK